MKLSAEVVGLGAIEQHLHRIKIMNHRRLQWILARKILHDARRSMTHAIDGEEGHGRLVC